MRWLRLLVILSSLACATTALFFILAAATPLWLFHGYVVGYYSLLGYSLQYAHDGQPVLMPHTDYVRHVAVTFTLLSLALLMLSPLSILLLRRRVGAAAGLAYGVATGLGVLYGLLYGYLCRAMSSDLGRFAFLMGRPNNEVMLRTSAGLILFEGVKLESTFVHNLVFRSPVPLIILALAITASSVAAVLALHAAYEREPENGTKGRRALQRGSAYAALFLLSFSALASVFTYYPSALAVRPQPPPATLEPPPYIYVWNLTRVGRGALVYTDFETYPLPGWTSYGGIWSSISGVAGAKGNVLQGRDDESGIGKSSYFYYNSDLSTYTSLWVVVKTRFVDKTKKEQYYGIAMLNAARNRVFAVALENDKKEFEIRSYDVTAARAWRQEVKTAVTGYTSGAWYTIVIRYVVSGTTISITAYLYDWNGNLVTTLSINITNPNVFTPYYLGVYSDGAIAQFDEFAVSTIDPRSVLFTGLQAGMTVEIWDNLGYLVAFGTAVGSSLSLSVVRDVVVGTGVDGRIVVKFPNGSICVDYRVPSTDAILGGDSYRLDLTLVPPPGLNVTLGANKTSATVLAAISGSSDRVTRLAFLRVSASQALYARLILDTIAAPSTLNLDLWLEGAANSTSLTIRNGVPISSSTSVVPLNLGLNNRIVLSGYFTAPGQSATLILKLELCTAPGGSGACVYYPITLRPSS